MVEKKSIGEIAEVFVGLNINNYKDEFSSSFASSVREVKIISISNIDSDGFFTGDFQKIKDVGERIVNCKVIEGDVVVNSRGRSIKSAVVDIDRDGYLINSNVIAIRIKEDFKKFISSEILDLYIRQGRAANEIIKSSNASTMLVLTKEILRNITVPLLDEAKQTKISNLIAIYRDINREIEGCRNLLSTLSSNIVNMMEEE
ncbi:MAG: restriction endonuclease subunit S [bacterium]